MFSACGVTGSGSHKHERERSDLQIAAAKLAGTPLREQSNQFNPNDHVNMAQSSMTHSLCEEHSGGGQCDASD